MTNIEQEIVDILYILVRAKYLKHGNNIDNNDRKIECISPRYTFIDAKTLLYDRTAEHPKKEDKGMLFYIAHYKNPFNAADGCTIHVMNDYFT